MITKNKINLFSFILLSLLVVFSYNQFFFHKKIPLPTDLLVGAYYPWLDYKWGTITGVPIKNPIISDVFSQFFPWKELIVDIFRQKEIPLWNQYSYSGTPILGNYHSGVFFPGNIFLFISQNYGWGLFIFFQTFFAAIGMFLFLKNHCKYPLVRVISALIFCFSGLMTTWTEFGTGTWAAAMIPWILFFIDKYFLNKKVSNLILSCFFLTSLYLAGNAQITLFGSLIIGAYTIKVYLSQKTRSLNNFITITTFLLLSIGVAAIALFPAYQQENLSVRKSEAYSSTFNYGLTPINELIRIYIPDFFGNPTTYNFWGTVSYHENSCFLGSLTLAFILPLFFVKKYRKKSYFWLIIFALSIFLALDSPITHFIYKQPFPLLTYSFASRIFFVSGLSASILLSYGLSVFTEDKTYRKKTILSSLVLIVCFILEIILLKNKGVSDVNLFVSLRNSVIPLGGLCMLIIISFLKIKPKIFIWLFVLFFYFDLSRYFLKYNTFIDQNFIFPKTPAIEFLEQDKDIFRIGRLSREVLTPNTWIQYKLSSVEGYDPLALENYSRFFNRVNQNKYSDPINRYSELYTPDINFLSALNVKYLLSVENEKNAPSSFVKKYNLQPIFRDKSTVIYKNNNYLPRVYFVEKTTLFDDKEELTERLNGLDFNPLKETLVLSNKAESRNDWSVGNVTLKELKNNSMSIETDNKNDGFLVISNAYHPGWHIYIDNIEKEMYEVNGGLCGTYVPQGKHIVTAKYWPKSVEIGIKVSLISTFSAIILSLYLFFKSHK